MVSSNAVVVYGGPLSGSDPASEITAVPASEGVLGLGLNNNGDSIIIRNGNSNLVSRIVYSNVPSNSSLTRAPDFNGDFVAHASVSANAVSPGRNFDGSTFYLPLVPETVVINVDVAASGGVIVLHWNIQNGRTYSVHQSATVDGPSNVVASGLVNGQYSPLDQSVSASAFFWISSP